MKEHRTKVLRVTTTNNIASSQNEHPEPDADMLGGIQLLKLELELQNTWRHIDWGPGNKCFEKMDCETHCQDEWFSKSPSFCRSYEGSRDELYNDSKTNLIKFLLKSSRNDANIREHCSRNSKFNRLFLRNCVHCSRSQNKLKMTLNPLEQLLYGNLQENWANIVEAIKLLILFRNDRLLSSQQSKQQQSQQPQQQQQNHLQGIHEGFPGKSHPYLSSRDEDENTPLLYAGRRLLKERAFRKALALTELLIQAGSDVNAVNVEGRTLLTYSVQYFDESFELTRLLINSGATVWPMTIDVGPPNSGGTGAGGFGKTGNQTMMAAMTTINFQNQGYGKAQPPTDVTNVFRLDKCKKEVLYFGPQYRESGNCTEKNSAFTWFLRSIIRCRKLNANSEKTLTVLCEIMGENPERMHGHVMRTMFRHAKCFKVLGPVFYQLKSFMMPYWRQPKDLRYLCRKEIRRILGPTGRLRSGVNKLALPKKMGGDVGRRYRGFGGANPPFECKILLPHYNGTPSRHLQYHPAPGTNPLNLLGYLH